MGLNDKIKGAYYKSYEATLASRTSIYNILNELKDYYANLTDLIKNTYNKITINRTEMIEKLNAILVKINYIQFNIDNFRLEIDSSIEEKLKKLMDNFDQDFIKFVETYQTNLYNHSKLSDQTLTNQVNYTQPLEEYQKSVEKLNMDIGIRWFGSKFNDKMVLNQLNSLLHIIKSNNSEGISDNDYINSNLILDIFIYSSKGITWLKIGKNATFGHNLLVKYNSLKNNDINIKLQSSNYYNIKDYEINKFDMNLLVDLGYDEEYAKNNNIYIKIKTNIPSNSLSGLEEYYLDSPDKLNEFNSTNNINSLENMHSEYNNRDSAYIGVDNKKNLETIRSNGKKYDSETNYIPDFVDEIDKTNKIENDNFIIYSEIKSNKDTDATKNTLTSVTKRITDDKEINGVEDGIGPIVVNSNENIEYNNKYIDQNNDILYNKEDENENIVYKDDKQKIDLLDYRNVGDVEIDLQNENLYIIENDIDDNNDTNLIGTIRTLKDNKNPSINNDVLNNKILDINSDNSFEEDSYSVNRLFIHVTNDSDITIKKIEIVKEIKNVLDSSSINLIKVALQDEDDDENDVYYKYVIQLIYDIDDNVYIIPSHIIYDIVQLNNGTLYLFTDSGIHFISSENLKNKKLTIEDTNIINGIFTTAHLTEDKKSFYCISSNGTSSYDNEKNEYKLVNFLYIYDPDSTEIKDIGDYCNLKNIDDSIIKNSDKSLIDDLISSITKGYSLVKSEKYSKWLILHKDDKKIYISRDENFGNFELLVTDKEISYINDWSSDIEVYASAGLSEDLLKLSYINNKYDFIQIMKAETYVENNLNKFKRNIQLECNTNMTGEGLTQEELVKELTTPVKYNGKDPIIINDQFYIPGEEITDLVFVNGYYYVLVPNGNVIYKISQEKIMVAQINIDDPLCIFSINNSFGIYKGVTHAIIGANISLYTDKETIKSHQEIYNKLGKSIKIVTSNKK